MNGQEHIAFREGVHSAFIWLWQSGHITLEDFQKPIKEAHYEFLMERDKEITHRTLFEHMKVCTTPNINFLPPEERKFYTELLVIDKGVKNE